MQLGQCREQHCLSNCNYPAAAVGPLLQVGARSVLLEGSLMEDYTVLQPGSVLPPTRRVPEGEAAAEQHHTAA